jgi:hypothetical protein
MTDGEEKMQTTKQHAGTLEKTLRYTTGPVEVTADKLKRPRAEILHLVDENLVFKGNMRS